MEEDIRRIREWKMEYGEEMIGKINEEEFKENIIHYLKTIEVQENKTSEYKKGFEAGLNHRG